MGRERRPRLPGFSYVGKYRYFLTFCVSDRRSVFADVDLVAEVLWQFRHFAVKTGFKETAYVVMPDHIHTVFAGTTDAADLGAFVTRAKQKTGFDYKSRTQRSLWQPSFYDHIVRDDRDLWSIIRYMVLNPVRAGLVADPKDYPHWAVNGWTREEVMDDVRRHPGDLWIPPKKAQGSGQD